MTVFAELIDTRREVLVNSRQAGREAGVTETAATSVDRPRACFISAIQSHEIAELDAIALYRDLATRATDPVIAGLLRVLLQDEERHHGILQAIGMDSRLAAGRYGRESQRRQDLPTAASLELLRNFARQESDGATELKGLAHRAPELVGDVFSLLLELMAMDSLKHEKVLRFIVRSLEPAAEV
jgi:hypothetical protein